MSEVLLCVHLPHHFVVIYGFGEKVLPSKDWDDSVGLALDLVRKAERTARDLRKIIAKPAPGNCQDNHEWHDEPPELQPERVAVLECDPCADSSNDW